MNLYSYLRNKKGLTIIILIVALLIMIGVTVWAIFFRETSPDLAPDYAPHQLEKNAKPYEEDPNTDKMQQEEGGGAVSLSYTTEVLIDLSERTAFLMFANPNKSNQDMMLQMIVQDTVIAQSGIISPGYRVSELDIFDNIELSDGTYSGKYLVLFYQQDTGEKAMVNTEIPITITVEN